MTGNVPIAENYAITNMRVADATYMWTIKNFSYYSNPTGQKLYSPIFTVGDDADLKWRLDLFPMGYSKPKCISLYLHLRRAYYHAITAQFRFSILNHKGEVAYQLPWSPKHTFSECDVWGYEDFIKREDLLRDAEILLPDDKLTIYCEVKASIGYEITRTEITKAHPSPYNSEHEVCNDFQWLWQTGQFSDITLILNGMQFLAHKCILASRSSVFQQMFKEHSLIGNELHLIDLSEFENKVIMEVLRYMYTGKIENLHLLGSDILAAAVRYDLQGLKLVCEEHFIHGLHVNNAWQLLVTADRHKAFKLRLRAINFITEHAKEMIDSPGYIFTQNSYPHLVTEVFNAMVFANIIS